jgi:hypothetical protein
MEKETLEDEEGLSDEQLEASHRVYLSEIMRQLTESDRFNRFFKVNYEVQVHLDKQNKSYDIRLIERPPELAAQVLKDLVVEHSKDHSPSVVLPTAADIAALKGDVNKK